MKKTQHNHQIYHSTLGEMRQEPYVVSYGHSAHESPSMEFVSKEDYDAVSDMAAGNVCNYCFNEMDKNADIQIKRKSDYDLLEAENKLLKKKLEKCMEQRDNINNAYSPHSEVEIIHMNKQLDEIKE